MNSNIQDAKARVNIRDLWRHFGFEGEPQNSCRCPFHEDRNPSFSISGNGQLWNCFGGCGGGDAVTFLERAGNLSNTEACRQIVELAGGSRIQTQPLKQCHADYEKPVVLPNMHAGDSKQLHALAQLRRLSYEAVALANDRGLLRFGSWKNRDAWFVTDQVGRTCQARRIDGKPWEEIKNKKAWTICQKGDARWPIGITESANYPGIALVEGGPDLLAAFHFIHCESKQKKCSPVAILGASNKIHPEALSMFDGKYVRIFGHADEAGELAVNNWFDQLKQAGATVDAFRFNGLRRTDESAVGDLNDLTDIHADDFEEHRVLWGILSGMEVQP